MVIDTFQASFVATRSGSQGALMRCLSGYIVYIQIKYTVSKGHQLLEWQV